MASVQAAEMSVTGLFACPGSSPAQGHDTQGLACGVAEVLPTNKLAHQGGHRYAKWPSLCRTTRGTPVTGKQSPMVGTKCVRERRLGHRWIGFTDEIPM
ncbi:hypothetical protein OsJ_26455 [Oryza sativa Japonica Group]|uniref:Uncharacterized protein n=2 Tax=Oryza TaxID=4527 RepID=Q6ZKG2_ORYSJ|nr:hypothetical protein OsJ_26455 [Oryza sativa Japonica Group]BAC75830.1 hypothetical protein [Oryza sativa Japonica Group]BAD03037.1 hypothetical protein [Oryza sativa Japonica Group]